MRIVLAFTLRCIRAKINTNKSGANKKKCAYAFFTPQSALASHSVAQTVSTHSPSTEHRFDKFNLCIFMAWCFVLCGCHARHRAENSVHMHLAPIVWVYICSVRTAANGIADISDGAQKHSLHSTHLSLSMFLWMGFLLHFICSHNAHNAHNTSSIVECILFYANLIFCVSSTRTAAGIFIKKHTNYNTTNSHRHDFPTGDKFTSYGR